MNNYELLLVLPGTLAETEVSPLVEQVKGMIEKNGGTNLEIGEVEKRRLSYPIKLIRYGYFQLVYFKAEPQAVKMIEKQLSLMTELLRALVKKYSANNKAEKKINFGMLTVGEDTRRPNENMVATPEVVTETVSVKAEMKPEDFAPVRKASAPKREEKKKVNLDDIDKKLDEILDIDLDKV